MFRRLKTASRAFISIFFRRPHIFCDEKTVSLLGTYREIGKYHSEITEVYNNGIASERVVAAAKQILG